MVTELLSGKTQETLGTYHPWLGVDLHKALDKDALPVGLPG